jgi:malonate transporter
MTHVILMALAPVFFVMALGYFAGRTRAIDNQHVGMLNTLVMSFAVPASLFVATASAPRREMMEQGSLFAVLGGVMLVVYFLWYLFQRRFSKTSRGEAAAQALTVAFPNVAGVGLPIASAVLGPTGTVPVAIAIAAGSILVTPITLLLLELSAAKPRDDAEGRGAWLRRLLRAALVKPIVLAPVLGIMLSLAGFNPGAVADASLQLIGQAAGGGALFLTGLVLSAQSPRLDRTVMGATLTADVLRPLLVAAIVLILPVPAAIAKVSILLAAVPSGLFGILLGLGHGVDSRETGSMVVASTLFSIVTLAVAIAVLYPH